MAKTGSDVIKDFANTLNDLPGVYRMLDTEGQVLYVGKAKRLKRRVLSYTREQDSRRIALMVSKTASMMALTTRTENEALILEQQLVRELNPPYNVRLKDGKRFPGLLLTTAHDYPRITKHRGKPGKGNRFFGPFADGRSVEHAVRQIQRLFMLRTCDDATLNSRTRPCLLHQIHKCTAPCVGKVSKEDYDTQVKTAIAFMEGKRKDIAKTLEDTMMKAAQEERFEDAARDRDRLKALMQIQEDQHVVAKNVDSADVVAIHSDGAHACIQVLFIRNGQMRGNSEHHLSTQHETQQTVLDAFLEQFYTQTEPPKELILSTAPSDPDWIKDALQDHWDRTITLSTPQRGEKLNLVTTGLRNAQESLARKQAGRKAWSQNLTALSEKLDIPNIKTVEVYDNSHIQGSYALGVAVVASEEGFLKSHYRKYNFPKESGIAGNDVGMMEAMLKRRFKRMKEEETQLPDLLLIDGGITQLRAALTALASLDLTIPCVGVAKGEDRDAGKETLHFPDGRAIALPMKDPTLYFIQRLRDEAHRFAITSHRQARSRGTRKGPLDDIAGLGPAKKRSLTARFGSQKAAKAASIEELTQLPGISADLAERIKEA